MVVTTDRIREERLWVLTGFSLALFVCFPLSVLRPVQVSKVPRATGEAVLKCR